MWPSAVRRCADWMMSANKLDSNTVAKNLHGTRKFYGCNSTRYCLYRYGVTSAPAPPLHHIVRKCFVDVGDMRTVLKDELVKVG